MINRLNHFALTAHKTIYDEEALSSLELLGRIGAKINEIITNVNEVNEMVEGLPAEVENALNREIANGNIANIVGPSVLAELGGALDELNNRISRIVASSGQDNTEVVDMRTGHSVTYPTAGDHVRALADGSAFNDAVRPGTVQHGRIMAGMLGGSLAEDHTRLMVQPMAGKWGGSGYFDKATLALVAHTGYSVTNTIPCKYGDTFVLKSYLFGPRVYPAAVLNGVGQIIEVIGTPGRSNWNVIDDAVTVTRQDAAMIRFVCGVGYESQFRAYRVTPETETDPAAAMASKGYLHMIAKQRTDTVTDRAQIKVWFKRPDKVTLYNIPLRLYKWKNLKGYTFRVFGANEVGAYTQQLTESASGYTFDPDKGIEVNIGHSQVDAYPYICLFIDLLPVDGTQPMDVYLPQVALDGDIWGVGYALHGALASDQLRIVHPAALGSPLYQKKLLGVGDSLMRGNTLPVSMSWFNLSAGRYDMEFNNAAVNGQSVAQMSDAIDSVLAAFPQPDYFMINGGANDLRLGVDLATFREAIINIITKVRANNPRVKILALTNWERSEYTNGLGLIESDYVEAMLEVCEALNVVCLNNYADSLNMKDAATQSWADEGVVSGGEPNLHFSEAANIHLMPRICAALESL